MAEIVWTNPALEQLDDLAQYIALDKPDAARTLVRKVVEAVGRLAEFPLSGRIPGELPDSVYREIVVPPCRVFYRVSNTTVFIIHIMREERVLRAHMLK
ncbi:MULTISPECIES: type II toxin-antitoxin system RelE/ParE family toxin [unclassified Pseudomonas]|jgi:plasmid stabilization system protein ParE|uniref:type II toxin-antitoxin system RelE/ParE family toxin n=1 Tax=unclassified Pseudomonas TaxID=196821 RepID=UPI000DAF3294|nr:MULTISPECIES: type II toxin-antitoxin system RelE/ParE family toxin [unclassified Pseudomonas]MBD9657581.1 type II toxin-antitoxin system RelE/ParE family toxin [Pseudomonas sp. PDM12]PZW41208.1 plasmid stabilization system protein ParE [Pseudomonas sp. URMO17WK12:I2]CAH0226655.1 Toxin RelE2 [Pseudomonas sp. Bi70]